jgi:hypothetical protein
MNKPAARRPIRIAPTDLVLCQSDAGDGGWSLHAPGSTDEAIAEGIALALASGTGEPTRADYAAALQALADNV